MGKNKNISKTELAFRKMLRRKALFDDYDWYVSGLKTGSKIKYPILNSIDSLFLGRYRIMWGWFRKIYLPKFNYILTDKWEDIEYKFAYGNYPMCLFALRRGDWVDIKGGHDTVFYKPNYKQRSWEEIKNIRVSNKGFYNTNEQEEDKK